MENSAILLVLVGHSAKTVSVIATPLHAWVAFPVTSGNIVIKIAVAAKTENATRKMAPALETVSKVFSAQSVTSSAINDAQSAIG